MTAVASSSSSSSFLATKRYLQLTFGISYIKVLYCWSLPTAALSFSNYIRS